MYSNRTSNRVEEASYRLRTKRDSRRGSPTKRLGALAAGLVALLAASPASIVAYASPPVLVGAASNGLGSPDGLARLSPRGGLVSPIQGLVGGSVGGLIGALSTVVSPAATTSTYSVPPTVDPTGSEDVTQELVDFFASVPDSSVIDFPASAQYRAEGSLRFDNRNNLTIEGNGARIFADSWAGDEHKHVWFVGGSNIVIRNLEVTGSNIFGGTQDFAYWPSKEHEHGFTFHGVTGVELDNVKVTKTFGDFVYLGGSRGVRTTDVWIHDSEFSANGRQGIAMTDTSGVLIEENNLSRVRRSTFDLEPGAVGRVVENVVIRNNDIGEGRLLFIAAGGAGTVNNVEVSGNRLVGKKFSLDVQTPEGFRRAGWRVFNNVSDTQTGVSVAPMDFLRVDGIEVSGNDVGPLSRSLVRAVDSCSIDVSGNMVGGTAVELEELGTYVCP